MYLNELQAIEQKQKCRVCGDGTVRFYLVYRQVYVPAVESSVKRSGASSV
jgi:hypothetical protein